MVVLYITVPRVLRKGTRTTGAGVDPVYVPGE